MQEIYDEDTEELDYDDLGECRICSNFCYEIFCDPYSQITTCCNCRALLGRNTFEACCSCLENMIKFVKFYSRVIPLTNFLENVK
jgi:hypothetical protein